MPALAKLLAEKGINEGEISHLLTALEISGAQMSSAPARDVCSIILDKILDFFLFSRKVEESITVVVCGEDEEITTTTTCTSTPSQSPSEGPTITRSFGDGGEYGNTCNSDKDCGCGLYC
eukprot:CAMPEP_0181110292 /NCGR_PEP_ID=MMETSP1071-20121207/18640_1 /TAXON_ID=35127 /ORGANISM="Thalassiosira sp., Strain NH16" /LENGTH=119 /DNA_ID=CAMNT_0023194061 /DNA_START=159 /DNA_END=516 /DNA_ORIENTATION=-